jgi:peptidoglycan/xylan/chitin deacetylase (PgdA/CDA1 family)
VPESVAPQWIRSAELDCTDPSDDRGVVEHYAMQLLSLQSACTVQVIRVDCSKVDTMDEQAARQVTVLITFDFDAMAPWINLGSRSPSFLSRGEFGPIGVERLLAVLRERGIKGTYFVPGHTALCYPAVVEAIAAEGHEVGHHGWVHEPPSSLAEAEERTCLERGLEAFERIGIPRPVGYRAPAWELSENSIRLLHEYGFHYDSSMMGSDFEPYWCRIGDIVDEQNAFQFGEPIDIVELPVSWHLDDVPLFDFIVLSARGAQIQLPGLRPPSDALEIWQSEFDYVHTRVQEGVFVLTLHPQVTGRGHRIMMLEQLLDHMMQFSDVRFSRCGDYADDWAMGREPCLPRAVRPESITETP